MILRDRCSASYDLALLFMVGAVRSFETWDRTNHRTTSVPGRQQKKDRCIDGSMDRWIDGWIDRERERHTHTHTRAESKRQRAIEK